MSGICLSGLDVEQPRPQAVLAELVPFMVGVQALPASNHHSISTIAIIRMRLSAASEIAWRLSTSLSDAALVRIG